jgi:hypothetical protein
MNMSDETFVPEVDEELQRDQLIGFWKQWGRWLVGGVVAAMLAWGGWLYWTHQKTEAAGVEGEKLTGVIENLSANKVDATTADLAALAKSDAKGYRAAAMMTQAVVALTKKDTKFAIATYGKVAADTSLSQPWRDLALVRQTIVEFDTIKPETVVSRLKPLAIPGNAWFGTAGELTALAYAKMGKNDLASKMFAEIAKDQTVPESIQSRAEAMASSLSGAAPMTGAGTGAPTTAAATAGATKEVKQ